MDTLHVEITRIAPRDNDMVGITLRQENRRLWTEVARCNATEALNVGDRVRFDGETTGISRDGGMTFFHTTHINGSELRDPDAIGTLLDNVVGTYTIVRQVQFSPTRRTFKIGPVISEAQSLNWIGNANLAGQRSIKLLVGPDNETSFQSVAYTRPNSNQVILKRAYRNDTTMVQALSALLAQDRTEMRAMGYAYALESGNCYICGRTLTVPASILAGVGPTCAGNYGIPYGQEADRIATSAAVTANLNAGCDVHAISNCGVCDLTRVVEARARGEDAQAVGYGGDVAKLVSANRDAVERM